MPPRAARSGYPLGVALLVAANVAVFAAAAAIADPAARDRFVDGFALVPYDLVANVRPDGFPLPAAATIVTSQFVHVGVLHVLFNMAFLVTFGPLVEATFGTPRFLGFYLLCGACGALAQVSMDPFSHVPIAGASGAVAGVLGAFVLRFPTLRIARVPAFVAIGTWIAVQVAHGFGSMPADGASHGVAYLAHVGGFVAGVLVPQFAGGRAASPRRARART